MNFTPSSSSNRSDGWKYNPNYKDIYQDRIKQFLSRSPQNESEVKFFELLQISLNWARDNGRTMPKIVMQTWKNNEIPDHWKCSPKSFKTHMKDWKHVLMTDEDNDRFTELFFPEFMETFSGFKHPIMRADAIRYMFLYIIGGLYLDLDYELLQDLGSLLDQMDSQCYLVNSGNINSLTNSLMASKPGCELWLEVVNHMKNMTDTKQQPWWFFNKHFKVMGTTGPMALQKMVNLTKVPYGMLPSKLINPCSVCESDPGSVCDAKGAYFTPLPGRSWNGEDSKLINSVFCRPQQTILAVLLIFLLVMALLFYIGRTHSRRSALMLGLILFAILLIFLLPKFFADS